MTEADRTSGPAVCELCRKACAAVFVARKSGDSEQRQALCLQCAEKQKIPSVQEYVQQRKNTETASPMCKLCGELPATVFVSVSAEGKAPEQQALCAFCAREKGLRPVTEVLEHMDVSDEELRQIHTELLNRSQEQQPEGFLQKLRRKFKRS